MTRSANLGFPRIGAKRELKKATEAYWKGDIDRAGLLDVGAQIRAANWRLQQAAGIDVIPSNDFSFYDQGLDMAATVGAVPSRFGHAGGPVDLDTYFAMARGREDTPAMEMTKWFDTNYHYIVPEFRADQDFELCSRKAVDEYLEARALGIETRPVLLGPVSFLALGKAKEDSLQPMSLLDRLLPVYKQLLDMLGAAGARWVQMDEPILALDAPDAQREACLTAYTDLSGVAPKLMIATYFEALRDNMEMAAALPVSGLHVDLVRAPEQLDTALETLPAHMILSLGVVDGRNIWRNDLSRTLQTIEAATAARGRDRIEVAPSCSLLHCPVDLDNETRLDDELRSWLAFSKQKLAEVVALATAADEGKAAVADDIEASDAAIASRRSSSRIHRTRVREQLKSIDAKAVERTSPYEARRRKQREHLALPAFPTTTIGSFPQTPDVRRARSDYRRGKMSSQAYDAFLRKEIEAAVRSQESLGLDVLVHGEFERNDMVEYFGEQLEGFAFTRLGWVQSYGSRYVKPPIIYGDVARPEPMTVKWSAYAQSLTDRPMKGMLTGPVTILQWSFVRDDQPRSETCRQIALAIRDEVADLERAGIRVIQVDEPALREGLPLRRSDWDSYLDWAVDSFRLATSVVSDETQIHTHMCYAEFQDIMPAIAALDADVISIETSRSDMELLDSFVDFSYPNEIGPGIWDIHSPRVPSSEEMRDLLAKAADVIDANRIWVNPDCGLKTRAWDEVRVSLQNLVLAAQELRESPIASAKA
mgnify:CR=1 FL=1